jgi:ABC-type lipoprotein export system ATPase subunit
MVELHHVKPKPLWDMQGGINPRSKAFGVPCRFEKGKKYLVEAPSGKGKSTLLHIIYGLRNDYEGEVSIAGKNVRTFLPDDWAKCRQECLSIVFQDLRLFPKLTALENIVLKSALKTNLTEPEIKAMAARLGVAEVLNQTSETLSYGQRQRVAIIRALCQPFDYLLLDEPFSNLDEENTAAASALILETCQRQGAGLILASLGERFSIQYDEEWEL